MVTIIITTPEEEATAGSLNLIEAMQGSSLRKKAETASGLQAGRRTRDSIPTIAWLA